MSLELIGGALLGAAVSELLKAVIHAKATATNFKPSLEKLTITLQSVITKVEEIKQLDDEERMRTDGQKGLDLNRLIMLVRQGKILVEKCSAVGSWNLISKNKYSGKIQEFDDDLIRFFQLDAQVAILIDVKKIWGMVNNLDQQLKQLTTERENGSSSKNGAAARDGEGVNDLKAAVPIKSTMLMSSSVPQTVGSAKANEKLDRRFERTVPFKAVPIKLAIIITSADPQKVGSAEASEKLDRHPESAAPVNRINPYDKVLKAAVPITSDDIQKGIISTSESTAPTASINDAVSALGVMSFPDVVSWYDKSFGVVAKITLSVGTDLDMILNCDSEEIKTNSRDTEYEPPFVYRIIHSSAFLLRKEQLVVVTKVRNFRPLDIKYIYERVKRKHRRYMELVEIIRHENVVPLRAYYCRFRLVPDNYPRCLNVKIVLVYEYYRKGSVYKMLHGKPKVPFRWDSRLRVAIGVARGIAFIHRQENGTFFHGGIKSENIFLNAGNYGCISELGKCIAGYEPYATGSRGTLRELDVYNFGVILLELVTGIVPHKGIVEKFKTCVGSREQLVSKVECFICLKQLNPEDPFFQLLDPELVQHYGQFKEQLIEMLRIAWNCVEYGAPEMDDVVKMVEGISDPYFDLWKLMTENCPTAEPIKPAIKISSADPHIAGSAKASEKLDRHSKSAAPMIRYKPFPCHRDLKAEVPFKPAIILTSADPQKLGSAKASEELDCRSESAAPIKPYDLNLKVVPITSASQKYIINTSESSSINGSVAAASVVMSFRNVENVAGYYKSDGGIARTSLSDLKFWLNCDYEDIGTLSYSDSTAYKTPGSLSGPVYWSKATKKQTHWSAILYEASQLVVLTTFRKYNGLNTNCNYDRIRMDHHRHMGLVESVSHENVVPLRAYCYHFVPGNEGSCSLDVGIILVNDYYRRSSVYQMLHHGEPKVPLDWDTRLRAAIGAARGIAFIHRQDNGTFFHGGIKSENIFLNTGNYGCISELGKVLTGSAEPYIRNHPGRALDVYNYGVFLLELVTGNFPFDDLVRYVMKCLYLEVHLIYKIEHFIRSKQLKPKELRFQLLDPELVKHYEELKGQLIEMLRIALDCLNDNSLERPSMEDVLKRVEGIGRLQLPLEFQHPLEDE